MLDKQVVLHRVGKICKSQWTALFVGLLGMFFCMLLLTKLDARDVSKGQQVHSGFEVAIVFDTDKTAFEVHSIRQIQDSTKDGRGFSFLMPKKHDENEYGDSYTVLEAHVGEQIISAETHFSVSRYRATDKTITPIYSEDLYFARFLFHGIVTGFLLGFGVYYWGKFLIRKYPAN